MIRRTRLIFFLMPILLAETIFSQTTDNIRKWSAVTGEQVSARYIKTEKNLIYLQRTDGRVVTVKLSSLSTEDRLYYKWNHTQRLWSDILLEDIPEFLSYAQSKLDEGDKTAYDSLHQALSEWILRNNATLSTIWDSDGRSLCSSTRGAKMHPNSFSAKEYKQRAETAKICAAIAASLLTGNYRGSPTKTSMREHNQLAVIHQEEELRQKELLEQADLLKREEDLRQKQRIEDDFRRANLERERRAAELERERRAAEQEADELAFKKLELAQKASSLEHDIRHGVNEDYQYSRFASKARSLSQEARNIDGFDSFNAASKFSNAADKLDAAARSYFPGRTGTGNSSLDGFNSPSRKLQDAARDISSGRSSLSFP